MIAIGLLFVRMLCDCFKSRQRLEAEILVLRHQLNVLQQRTPRRVALGRPGAPQFNTVQLIGTAAGAYNGEELVVRFSATNGPSSGSLNT